MTYIRMVVAGMLLAVSAVVCGAAWSSRAAAPNSAAAQTAQTPGGTASPRRPNVLIITIDTLRADRLGCYGYSRPTSPNLDALAAQSVVFDRAFSTSSFTPPSHASIFTSMYVSQHGLRTWNKLPDDRETLAETLLATGYRTGASVNLVLLTKNNLGQGFQWQREELRDGRIVVNNGLELVRDSSDKPFFIWLHFYDVHRPYAREGSWARQFNSDGRAGVGDSEKHYNILPAKLKSRGLSDDDLKFIEDRYDAGVAYIDSQLGPLLAELNSAEHLDNTMIVITADHGENLRDRPERLFAHDPFLYQEVTRVPLLVRYPRRKFAGTRSDAVVSLIDIAPTVLETAGIAPPKAYQGHSLLPLSAGGDWDRDAVFHETSGVAEAGAARTRDRLVLTNRKSGSTEYFDLARDPRELSPLKEPPDAAARSLADRLKAFTSAAKPQADAEIDPELKKKLKSLGYAGDDVDDDEEAYDPQSTAPRKNAKPPKKEQP